MGTSREWLVLQSPSSGSTPWANEGRATDPAPHRVCRPTRSSPAVLLGHVPSIAPSPGRLDHAISFARRSTPKEAEGGAGRAGSTGCDRITGISISTPYSCDDLVPGEGSKHVHKDWPKLPTVPMGYALLGTGSSGIRSSLS